MKPTSPTPNGGRGADRCHSDVVNVVFRSEEKNAH